MSWCLRIRYAYLNIVWHMIWILYDIWHTQKKSKFLCPEDVMLWKWDTTYTVGATCHLMKRPCLVWPGGGSMLRRNVTRLLCAAFSVFRTAPINSLLWKVRKQRASASRWLFSKQQGSWSGFNQYTTGSTVTNYRLFANREEDLREKRKEGGTKGGREGRRKFKESGTSLSAYFMNFQANTHD